MSVNIPKSPEEFLEESGSVFLNALKAPEYWSSIPLLNYTSLDLLKDFSIVRFRGMVQDMQDPEIYLERYEVFKDDMSKRTQNGKYRDMIMLNEGEEIDFDADTNVQGNRRSLFLISLPGINKWAHDYEDQCNLRAVPENVHCNVEKRTGSSKKRPAPDDEKLVEEKMEIEMKSMSMNSNGTDTEHNNKRQCSTSNDSADKPKDKALGNTYYLNFPIPKRPGKACLVKLYDNFDDYPLNSILEVVGFLSISPYLDGSSHSETEDFNDTEYQAQNPPPSLIPRLHAIAIHRLPHANPLLDLHLHYVSNENESNILHKSDDMQTLSVYKEMQTLFKLCLFDDDLAANYLIGHLISNVYGRPELVPVGKFALNLCNIPAGVEDFTKKLYEIIELILPASHYVPLSLNTLNTEKFFMKKDYDSNRIIAGQLQLAAHTHLILDETQLQQGNLDENGISAIKSLSYLIENQKVNCDYSYFNLDYEVDVPVAILSEGKSMLPHEFTVPFKADDESIRLNSESMKAAQHYLNGQRLNQFRRYITLAKTRNIDISSGLDETIQRDFVEMRKKETKTTGDDLHSLLVLSRVMSIAQGKKELDLECWELAKNMEAQRKERVNQLPVSSIKK